MSDEVEAFWKGSSKGGVKTLEMKFQFDDNRADHFDLSFGDVVSKKMVEIANNGGRHSRTPHPNILPSDGPCEDGKHKCLHDGWAKTFAEVVEEKSENELWIPFTVSNGGSRLATKFKDMDNWLLIILRGVLRAGIWLMDQDLVVGPITVNDIVFLKDDLNFEKPQIIDCLVTGRAKGHRDSSYLKSVAEMIKTKFTKGNLELVKDNPIIMSFVRCLEGHGRNLHGKPGTTRQEYNLFEHPLLLRFAQHCVYNDRVRDVFRNKRCFIYRSLDVNCVLEDEPSKKKRKYAASDGWKRLFKQHSTPGVMQFQLNEHDRYYHGGLVTDLVKIFRDTSAHVTGSIPPAEQVITLEDHENAGKPIKPETIGKYIKIICPRLLSYLFENYGTCDAEDKLR